MVRLDRSLYKLGPAAHDLEVGKRPLLDTCLPFLVSFDSLHVLHGLLVFVADGNVLVEVKLPVKQLDQALGDLCVAARASVFLDLPVDVAPLVDADAVSIGVGLRLKMDALHEEGLKPWHTEERNRDTDLHVAPKVGLDILSAELEQAVVEDLIEKSLVELSDLNLLLLDSLELDVLKILRLLLSAINYWLDPLGFIDFKKAFLFFSDGSVLISDVFRAAVVDAAPTHDTQHLLTHVHPGNVRTLPHNLHEFWTERHISELELISQEDLGEHLVIVSFELIPSVVCQ